MRSYLVVMDETEEAQGGVRTVSAAVNALAAQVNEAARSLERVVK